MTVLEHRLRSELRAESELITPESIVPLRLPGDTGQVPGVPRRRGPRQWPGWVVPLAAAAAAAAAIAGTFAIAHALPGSEGRPAGPDYAVLPAAYAYTVQGSIYSYTKHGTQYGESVNGRYLKVQATGTGKLLATVYPPKPYNDFQLISANAAGTVFVLGAAHNWDRNANTPARVQRRNPRTPMKFLEMRISAGSVHVSGLSLPVTVTPGQQPSIALSPDGARLAVAFGGGGQAAVLDVVTLASGRARRWVSPPVPWTPSVSLLGAWSADGRTLALQQWNVFRTPTPADQLHWHPPATTTVHLIDTFAPGGSLAAGKTLVLRPRAGEWAPWAVFLTPDGTKLIGATGKRAFRALRGVSRGELSVYSARTGALVARLAPWEWNNADRRGGHGGLPAETIAWSNPSGSQFILLHPQHELNVLGVLTGGSFRTAGPPLPQPAGYQELEYALRTADQVAW
ncbi:MAG TPA: hypothetical protein VGY50_06430 [Streptosporangiaceae bacterium]|nr:hypothetical protein [Streptosporangiaceae bacterium]